MALRLAVLAALAASVAGQSRGDVASVYALLERVLPGSSAHFDLSLVTSCPGTPGGKACFTLADAGAKVAVTGTTAAELTAGIGAYFRDFCNMTIGWDRGGGNNIFTPSPWPAVGAAVSRARVVPYSYYMNVCTHSYSLVWYSWADWEQLIDWMALSGINFALAMTGQEEVQYKVFRNLGLDDATIRNWFNGPAFLTWSRGQNEYGNCIAGPLPRSWMQSQWDLQRQILTRYRSLGIVSQLPGFQGNVPWALAALKGDSNITQQGDTGWMYSTDPLFATIADAWMAQLCNDFNCTDHWYQLDGYFDGGTAPWRTQGVGAPGSPGAIAAAQAQGRAPRLAPPAPALPACTWSALAADTYLAGCDAQNCKAFATVAAAQAACIADLSCGGITSQANGAAPFELRAGSQPATSPINESSYYITNAAECRPPPPPIQPDPVWMIRGAAAYEGLNRTDPDAQWSFQGWAIIDWGTPAEGSSFRGFVDAVPAGKFVVVDMSVDGSGEWQKWNDASFFGAPFVWTSLHDFGGTDGMKGNLERANLIPFSGLPPASNTTVIGTGYTPEGLFTDPVYYDFLMGANFRTAEVADITGHVVLRAHRRYSLTTPNAAVTRAWALLANSTYTQDLSVQDGTGVPHLPASATQFESNRYTPVPTLCTEFEAWGAFIDAADSVPPASAALETFRFDLVNIGREILAQLSCPVSQNFSDAFSAPAPLDAARINLTGSLYSDLLADVDRLVATDTGFLLGPWLDAARGMAQPGDNDCAQGDAPIACADFYEWNARAQLTTWNPTPKGASSVPGGPIDYASKHWSGLIKDYYKARLDGFIALALQDAAEGKAFDKAAAALLEAQLAYTWQNTFGNGYPLTPVGDAVAVSKELYAKYAPFYAGPCGAR